MYKRVPIFLPTNSIRWVMAGPTRELPPDRMLVRCAAEIDTPEDRIAFDLGTEDFTTFDPYMLKAVLPDLLKALERGDKLYVGCMGGSGRTGTLLAILAGQHPDMEGSDAIRYIRDVYKCAAIETQAQEDQVIKFSGSEVCDPVVDFNWEVEHKPLMSRGEPWYRKLWRMITLD